MNSNFDTYLAVASVASALVLLWDWFSQRGRERAPEATASKLVAICQPLFLLATLVLGIRLFGLEVCLVVTTALTGALTLWNRFGRREPRPETKAPANDLGEIGRSFFPVLLLVLVLRSFVFEPFRIPSGSMVPTLLEGDFIFVSKFSFGVKLPVIHTKIIDTGTPQRGDVVVFRLPSNPKINYIKRVIGLPGDQIEYKNGRMRVNGEVIRLEPGEWYVDHTGERYKDRSGRPGRAYTEFLDKGPHQVLHTNIAGSRSVVRRIPEGCYFMMGDNRENSTDSRFPQVGCVDEKFLVGRAGRVWFNFFLGRAPIWSRIGERIE